MSDPDVEIAGAARAAALAAPTRARYGVLAFTFVLTAIAYLDRICISTASSRIEADLGLNKEQMGYVFSAFTLAYALFEVPSGWLADRFGPRLMLARIVIWWSAFTAATGLATGFVSLLTLRLFFGIGEAGTFPSIARTYSRWLPEREHAKAFGLAVMTAALGGAVTGPLVVKMLTVMTWRQCFVVFGLVGAVWAIAWYFWFRDDPHHHPAVNAAELNLIGTHPPMPHPPVPWLKLLGNVNLWFVCLMYLGAIYGWYFYLTWLPQYLEKARHFSFHTAGWLSSLPLLVIALGVGGGGWLSDRLVKRYGPVFGRRAPGLVGLPMAALAVFGAVKTPSPVVALIFLCAAAGLAALCVGAAWAICVEIGGQHAGVVSGAMNTFGNLGGTLSPMVTGILLQRWDAWFAVARSAPSEPSPASWNAALLTLVPFYLLSALCWLRINPTEPIPDSQAPVAGKAECAPKL